KDQQQHEQVQHLAQPVEALEQTAEKLANHGSNLVGGWLPSMTTALASLASAHPARHAST
ncbi:MAG: hypothetical protein ACKOGN_08150, partial [Gammaproteobacteria bacterium]